MAFRDGREEAPGGRGVFCLSLDVELAWGCFYRVPAGSIRGRLGRARDALSRLVSPMAELGIPATWAFTGHLFLRECAGRHGALETRQSWYDGDWFRCDPGTSVARDPEWYAPDMVERIRGSFPGHEIGAHGFSHCFLDDEAVSEALFAQEIALTVEAARGLGVSLSSFVYPRNRAAHPERLEQAGFVAYRSQGRDMGRGARRGSAARAGHMARQALGIAPSLEPARAEGNGLVAIPGTALYLSTAGARRLIPMAARLRRGRAGLEKAARQGGLFHLWCHLEDFLESTDGYFDGFVSLLESAARLREREGLRILTMGDLAREIRKG